MVNEMQMLNTSPHQSTITSPIDNAEAIATTLSGTSSITFPTVTNPITPPIVTSTIPFPLMIYDVTTLPHGAFKPISFYPTSSTTITNYGFGDLNSNYTIATHEVLL